MELRAVRIGRRMGHEIVSGPDYSGVREAGNPPTSSKIEALGAASPRAPNDPTGKGVDQVLTALMLRQPWADRNHLSRPTFLAIPASVLVVVLVAKLFSTITLAVTLAR